MMCALWKDYLFWIVECDRGGAVIPRFALKQVRVDVSRHTLRNVSRDTMTKTRGRRVPSLPGRLTTHRNRAPDSSLVRTPCPACRAHPISTPPVLSSLKPHWYIIIVHRTGTTICLVHPTHCQHSGLVALTARTRARGSTSGKYVYLEMTRCPFSSRHRSKAQIKTRHLRKSRNRLSYHGTFEIQPRRVFLDQKIRIHALGS